MLRQQKLTPGGKAVFMKAVEFLYPCPTELRGRVYRNPFTNTPQASHIFLKNLL